MAPKPKKTKEEKAAEKAKKEEEARLAEEGECSWCFNHVVYRPSPVTSKQTASVYGMGAKFRDVVAERLRQEEEARKIAEQHEQSRQQLVQEFKAAENARVQQERCAWR